VSRSLIHHSKLPTSTEGTKEVYPEVQKENHRTKKGLPACYIESQATIEKKEQAVKEDRTVRLYLSRYREKTTKKRSTKRRTSTYIVVYKTHRYNREQESRIWT
jgi:hypothetical protein